MTNDLALLTEVLEERVTTSCREVLHEELQVLRDEVRIVLREELSGPISPRDDFGGTARARLRASSIAAMRRSTTGHSLQSLQSERLEGSSPAPCSSPTPNTPKTPKSPQPWANIKQFAGSSPVQPDLPNSLRAVGDADEIVRAPEDLPAPKTPKVAAPALPVDDTFAGWQGRHSQMSDTTNDDKLCRSQDTQASGTWAVSVPERSRGGRSSVRSSMMARIELPQIPTWSELLHMAVASPHFDSIFGFCVIMNAGIMGIQVDWMARNSSDEAPVIFDIFEKTFACIFIVELILRILAHGRRFFNKDVWFWHAFDSFLVGVQVFEEVAVMAADAAMAQQNNFSWLRVVRFLRLVRVIRTVRILRLVGELRTLVLSILGSLRALVWAVVLLFLLMYIIGIFITQLVLDYRLERSVDLLAAQPDLEETHTRILHYYGSLGDTILSIYKAVTGGVDWGDIVDPLDALISVYMVPFFMLYVAFSLLCMLNVITGVFVESALQSTKKDTSLYLFGRLKNLFTQHDLDGDGRISMHEFLIAAQTEEIRAVFTQLDLNISDADVVFQALDKCEVGLLSADEFIQGCQELAGAAKSLDLLVMKRESAKQVQRVDERTVKLENLVQMINKKVDGLGVALTNAKMAHLLGGKHRDHQHQSEGQQNAPQQPPPQLHFQQQQQQVSPTSPSVKQLFPSSPSPSPPHSPPHFLAAPSPAPSRSPSHTSGLPSPSPSTSPAPSPICSPATTAAAAAARARITRLGHQYTSTSSNTALNPSPNANAVANGSPIASLGAPNYVTCPDIDDDDDDEVVLLGGGHVPQEEV